MFEKIPLTVLAAAFLAANFLPAWAATYYSEQTNFTEHSVPVRKYQWKDDKIDACIYKDGSVANSYYAWTKISVQKWRQALREYTGNQQAWDLTARYVKSQAQLESCNVKIYIFDTYKKFPDYPRTTGAYTSIKESNLDIRVYLSPFILHGDGKTELNLRFYAFRNSAVHEIGHALGLGHMQTEKGYLMSPQFDFEQEKDQLPITTLELKALVSAYGKDGFN